MFKIFVVSFSLGLFSLASTIIPIPEDIDYDKKKAILGKKLFHDKNLSKDKTISCATCHILKDGGDDNLEVSIGIEGSLGSVNAPTVLNSVFNFRQFWDGRAKNLEEQAAGPIENPIEMAHNFTNLIEELEKTSYKEEFLSIYKDGITKKNIANAIAEFEKTLITPNSRFDRFLKGEEDILTSVEKEGYELFKTKGCITCHHGVNIGGNSYNKLGAIIEIQDNDNLGRYNVTKNEEDKYFYKVPSLRNIELTAPYFHDGRHADLDKTVKTMAMAQLGRPITSEEIEKIVVFLKTLTGNLKIINE